MSPALTPTNMTAAEMVPDTERDPRYWCLPPVRDQPSDGALGGYKMYLVTQGKVVGVWHNWTVAKAMVIHPGGTQRGHHRMAGCVAEWQKHCALGVHPHPPDPQGAVRPLAGAVKPVALRDLARLTLGAGSQTSGSLDLSNAEWEVSSTSSITATTWAGVPPDARYYAIWGKNIVYTDRGEARDAFHHEEGKGTTPRILSTLDFEEAQSFSEAVYWIVD
ncbi:hypothetical protein DFH06DRAFT_1351025 [Mycena polygramma]|nr:hypothetical protein DFH06DRAFT_1351025 [Mycena polygramma]